MGTICQDAQLNTKFNLRYEVNTVPANCYNNASVGEAELGQQ